MRLPFWLGIGLVLTCTAFAKSIQPPKATAPLLQNGNVRVVLVGDSITGQSRNHPAGYAHQLDWALQQAYPGCHPQIIALGGSGAGVQAWLNNERRSRTESVVLDVKGLDLKTELDQPADVLIVMLGMNDVLAPYVADDLESGQKWMASYRELITALQARLKPKVTAVATATLCTEDEQQSPKNRVMASLNYRLAELAGESRLFVLPTHATMADVLRRGRLLNPEFHVTGDYVHPNEAGHISIAMGMLRGLGETEAARALDDQRLAKILVSTHTLSREIPIPAPWLVATGLVRQGWNERQPIDPAHFRGPIEEAIESGGNFVGAPASAGGKALQWKPYMATVDYTGGANPDSVDFAAVTHARPFEAGYGARWIRSDRERSVNVELSTQTFAGTMELNVWLNGSQVYSGLINAEPGKKKRVAANLRAGWNTLVFCLNHITWQMQCTVKLTAGDHDSLDDLRYSIIAPWSKSVPQSAPR
jgi:lysophospholipase L1-like esterase